MGDNDEMIALVLAALAALLHVYIFWLESFAWTTPRGRATFGTSADEAAATRELAFNQGFYNLFLAIVTAVGIGFWAADSENVGRALVLAGCGSMLAAAIVLGVSSPSKAKAALTQGAFPALAVIAALASLI